MHAFSAAQCVGYAAFLLGVSAFLQKSDRRLKFLNGSQCVFYGAHFAMLANYPASASLVVSASRSFLSIKTRSLGLACVMLSANIAVGFLLSHSRAAWLPVIGGCAATLALFLLRGIPMRLLLLLSTLCWLSNNILSGSIGGTMLELTIATTNLWTMTRLFQANINRGAQPSKSADAAAD
jgi:Bacterial inner membrane protein